jgi:hypothetical protein
MSDKDLSKKIIKLDPLAERLDNVGMTGGVGKKPKSKKLSKEAKDALRETTKANLKYSKEVSKIGRRGDFGTPLMSGSVAKSLKTQAKEATLKSELDFPIISRFPKNITKKGKDEARKYLKKRKKEYERDSEYFNKKGYSKGGEARGTGAAIKGKGFKGVF